MQAAKNIGFLAHFGQITDFCWLGLLFVACSSRGSNAGRTERGCGIRHEKITTFSIVFFTCVFGMVLGVVLGTGCESRHSERDGRARPSSGGWRRRNCLVHNLGDRLGGSQTLEPPHFFHVGRNNLFRHLGCILTGLYQNAEQFVREERLHCRITKLCLHTNRNVRKQRFRSNGAKVA